MMIGKSWFGVGILMAAALAGACGGGDGGTRPDGAVEPDAPPDAPPPMPRVMGSALDTFATAAGDVKVPRDLSAAMISALVSKGDGTFTTFPGSGTAMGTFEIPGVPDGPYYLGIEGRFIVTAARTLDISRRFVGRTSQKAVAVATPLTLNIANMNAWQDTDFLEMYAPNAGAAFSSVELFANVPPTAGDTALAMTADYKSGELPNGLDATLGDTAFLTHIITRTSPQGVEYQALGAMANLQPFSLTSGTPATATGTFQAVAQNRARTVDWRITEFASLMTAAVPGGPTSFTSSLASYVEVDDRAFYSTPVVFNLTAPTSPDVLATVNYGNPFPATWKEFGVVSLFAFKTITIGGRNGTAFIGLSSRAAAGDLFAGAIRPSLGAVQNLRVANQDATGPLTGIPARPTITWDPPATGTANSYSVQVLRFTESGTRLARSTVGRFNTTGTSVTLPDGILMPGLPHYILVRAISHPNVGFERFLFQNSYPSSTTDRMTTVFTP
jgi:hypothetical protein